MLGFGAFNPAVKRCGFVREKTSGLICEQSVALENEGAVWTQLCRDMSNWPPPPPPITMDIMKPKNGIGLHLRDCHSVWSVSVEFFVLSNNIYLSSEAVLQGWGWGAPYRSEGVWYWWNMAGILKVFFLLSTHLSFNGFEARDLLSL